MWIRLFLLALTLELWSWGTANGQLAATANQPMASCASLVREFPDVPCALDFSRFPEPQGSTRAEVTLGQPHERWLVSNAAELESAAKRAWPGDQIVLRNGTWRDVKLKLRAVGEASRPIRIGPESKDGVVITGESSLDVVGEYLKVDNLQFINGKITRNRGAVIRFGDDLHGCNWCTLQNAIVDNFNGEPRYHGIWSTYYLVINGHDIAVTDSTFRDKDDFGQVIHAEHPAERHCYSVTVHDCTQRVMVARNRFYRISWGGNSDRTTSEPRAKAIELGSSHTAINRSFSVIEDNVFENVGGDVNAVVIKTSDVIVRRNRFTSGQGGLNIRSGNRTLIEGNLFDGTMSPGMAGVRVQGRAHWIVRNRFVGLRSPPNFYYRPIVMPAGAYEDLANNQEDYARPSDIVIGENVFDDVIQKPIVVDVYPDGSLGRALRAQNVHVVDNQFRLNPATEVVEGLVGNTILMPIGGWGDPTRIAFRGNKAIDASANR